MQLGVSDAISAPHAADSSASAGAGLSALFQGWEQWSAAFDLLPGRLAHLNAVQATPLTQGSDLLEKYQRACSLWELQGRLYCYAKLRRDSNTSDASAGDAMQAIERAFAKIATATSWFESDLAGVPEDVLRRWCADTPDLMQFLRPALQIIQANHHRLGTEGEGLLALVEPAFRSIVRAYEALSASVKIPIGRDTDLDASLSKSTDSPRDPSRRREAAESYHKSLGMHGAAFAALYATVLHRERFHSSARRFPSSLTAALFKLEVSEEHLRRLMAGTLAVRHVFQSYIDVRRRLLDLAEYHLYDNSMEPPGAPVSALTVDRISESVCKSTEVVAEWYADSLRALFERGHIDWIERPGKVRRAYCLSAYRTPPFVMASLGASLRSAQALAHECGHAMHTLLADAHQPFQTATYSSVVSEAVAMTHERMLMRHLAINAGSEAERKALQLQALDAALSGFFTQVMFLDFEVRAHELAEHGGSVSEQSLCDLYETVVTQYFGDAVTFDPFYRWSWARLGHLFRAPFYSASYAVSYAASGRLFKAMTAGSAAEQAEGRLRFTELLRSGGARPPLDLLRDAGADVGVDASINEVVTELEGHLISFL